MQNRSSTRLKKNLSNQSASPPCSPKLTRQSLREQTGDDLKHYLENKKLENRRIQEKDSEFETSDNSSDDCGLYGKESDVLTRKVCSKEVLATLECSLSQPQEQQGTVFMNKLLSKRAVIFTLLVVFGTLLAFNLNISTHTDEKPNKSPFVDPLDQTMKFLEEMQNSFPAQPRDTWISFLSALISVTEEEPSQPAVILLVGGNTAGSIQTMQCVANQLATVTNKLFSIIKFDDSFSTEVTVQVDNLYLQKREEIVKEELDARIHAILIKSHSIVFGPLENLPPQAALILHGYCDNFMAPFKDRVFILTATFDSGNRTLDFEQVDRRLHGLWDSNLGLDKAASLVSRVANNPVFIKPESVPCL